MSSLTVLLLILVGYLLAALFVATSGLVQVVQKAAIALAVPLAFAAAGAAGADPSPS